MTQVAGKGVREQKEPAHAPMPHPLENFQYLIALDLGSESMAAVFERRGDETPTPLDLQQFGEDLAPSTNGTGRKVDYLPGLMERERSRRLRTRTSLEGSRQPKPLPPEHASLDYNSDYGKSLFRIFHLVGETFGRPLLPNPKILFQTGATKVIPRVEDPSGSLVQHRSDELLYHLLAQIIKNIVLRAADLHQRSRDPEQPFDPAKAYLILTVPNVYSPTHLMRLESFIRSQGIVGWADAIYESDAVAFYMIREKLSDFDSKDVELFKARISDCMASRQQTLLLTIDIGKGTTDLTLAEFSKRQSGAGRLPYAVLARTGRSHGGARLTYLLAKHLEERMATAVESFCKEHKPAQAAALRKRLERHLSLTTREQEGERETKAQLLEEAERFIDLIKQSVDDDYSIRLRPEEQQFAVSPLVEAMVALAAIKEDAVLSEEAKRLLKEKLTEAFLFPERLTGSPNGFFSALLPRRKAIPADDPFIGLHESLVEYVCANVDVPLQWLREMTDSRERRQGFFPSRGRRQLPQGQTFVILAGQAAQFRPIRAAVERQVRELNLRPQRGGDLLMLESPLSKWACALGAHAGQMAGVDLANRGHVFGSFGFYRFAGSRKLALLDMVRFNRREPQVLELAEADYRFVYIPRHLESLEIDNAAELDEMFDSGAIATIKTLRFHGGPVTVTYQGTQAGIVIENAGRPDEVLGASTAFGGGNQEIFKNTWPEAIRIREESA